MIEGLSDDELFEAFYSWDEEHTGLPDTEYNEAVAFRDGARFGYERGSADADATALRGALGELVDAVRPLQTGTPVPQVRVFDALRAADALLHAEEAST